MAGLRSLGRRAATGPPQWLLLAMVLQLVLYGLGYLALRVAGSWCWWVLPLLGFGGERPVGGDALGRWAVASSSASIR